VGADVIKTEEQFLTADLAIANIRAAKAGLNLLRLHLAGR